MKTSTQPNSSDKKRDKPLDRPKVERISEIYWNLWSDMEKNGGGTESQYHLARRCAGLLALLEVWEQKFCSDKAVPTGTWNATVNTVRRLMQDIGLTRDGEGEPTPDLQEYIDQGATPSDGADITPLANRRAG